MRAETHIDVFPSRKSSTTRFLWIFLKHCQHGERKSNCNVLLICHGNNDTINNQPRTYSNFSTTRAAFTDFVRAHAAMIPDIVSTSSATSDPKGNFDKSSISKVPASNQSLFRSTKSFAFLISLSGGRDDGKAGSTKVFTFLLLLSGLLANLAVTSKRRH